jgi:hypothetical protein
MPMTLRHRPTLAGVLLAVVATLAAVPATPSAAADTSSPSYGSIATTGVAYVGTYQGQCWTFVKKVVAEATGRVIGFDYRQGFFEAGAVEVTPEEARNGDVIQVADDSYTGPDADYPGLHTSIVLENLGDGRFDVVDSNSRWDGMVRLRPGYDPFGHAAAHGLEVHIYRIPETPDGPGPSGPPAPAPGGGAAAPESATVSADGDGLNLRESPDIGSAVIATLPDGTRVTVIGGPVSAGGRDWLEVASSRGTGWVAAQYLVRANGGSPATGVGAPAPLFPHRTFAPMLTMN